MQPGVEAHPSRWLWHREPSRLTQVCIVTDATVEDNFEQALSTRLGNSPQVAWLHLTDPAATHGEWLASREHAHGQRVQRLGALVDGAELDAAQPEVGLASLDLGDGVVAGRVHRHEADGLTPDLPHERGHRVVGHHDPRRLGLQSEHDGASCGNDLPPVRLDGHAVDRTRGQPGRDTAEPVGPRRPLVVGVPEVRVHVGDH